jgi:uncharacterized repeat protein (TIGR02543 family)
MAILNAHLWYKAYMLEFLNNGIPVEYFTFSVPPESEDLDFPQRVSETKTFGGAVFDDYGNDTIRIQLSGTTINEEPKIIYRGVADTPKYLTGEKEIYELQGIINDWGKTGKLPSKEVYLYDLSKMSALEMASGRPSRNWWKVVIKNLRIRRSKDRPRTYGYTLDMVGITGEAKTLPPFLEGFDTVNSILGGIQTALETIQETYEMAEMVADAFDSAMKTAVDVKNEFERLQDAGKTEITSFALDAPVRVLSGGGGNSVYNAAQSCKSSFEKLDVIILEREQPEGSKGYTGSSSDIFTAAFDSAGGSSVAPVKVRYANRMKKPKDPFKPQHAFLGWYEDASYIKLFDFNTLITKDLKLYARWEQTAATVAFDSRLGSVVLPQEVPIGQAAQAPAPDPARSGYLLDCWCTDEAATAEYDFSTPVAGAMTLYARWRPVYTVVFDSGGGSETGSQIVEIGKKAIYPDIPVRENHLFKRWCSDEGLAAEFDFDTAISSDTTLYAEWERISNNVAFQSNGGSAVPLQAVPIGGAAARPEDPAKEGFVFLTWCADEAATVEYVFSTPVNAPITLYAKWDTEFLRIDFDADDGSAVGAQDVAYGGLVIYPLVPEKTGYLFDRWYRVKIIQNPEWTEESPPEVPEEILAEEDYDFSAPVTEAFTLHARWYGV